MLNTTRTTNFYSCALFYYKKNIYPLLMCKTPTRKYVLEFRMHKVNEVIQSSKSWSKIWSYMIYIYKLLLWPPSQFKLKHSNFKQLWSWLINFTTVNTCFVKEGNIIFVLENILKKMFSEPFSQQENVKVYVTSQFKFAIRTTSQCQIIRKSGQISTKLKLK